jgi:glycosyltransferase involved in cell wall biosynthesis
MEKPLVSIIIPVYNVELYVEKCINSIINQTYQNIEIIIINDGSTDNSGNVCHNFESSDARIRFVNQVNKGVSVARNLGLSMAQGEWVYFIDADDYLELNTIELLSNEFESNLDVIQFGLSVILDEKILRSKHPSEYKKVFQKTDLFRSIIMKPLSACLIIVKRSILIHNNIKFNTLLKHNEDSLFVFQILSNCNGLLFYDKAFYNMQLRSNSVTSRPITLSRINNKLIYLQLLIDYYKEKEMVNLITGDIEVSLKNFFMDISNYSFRNKDEKRQLNEDFRLFFIKNKLYLKSFFVRIAFIHIGIILFFLKLKKK